MLAPDLAEMNSSAETHKSIAPEDLENINHEELAYLDSLKRCLGRPPGPNRTGVATRTSRFECLRFSLADGAFPVLTTKQVALRSVFYELMWFIRGDTDTAWLREHGVGIWDGNTTREALDRAGLADSPVGYVGPAYGSQWRSFGGRGVDQLTRLVDSLKEAPESRRHLMVAWNPLDINQVALPPCHYSVQFLVDSANARPAEIIETRGATKGPQASACTSAGAGKKYILSCVVNMRSADAPLGVPFNIASYSLLVHIIAKILGWETGELVLCCANYHIYEPHVEAVQTQLARQPRKFPRLGFTCDLAGAAIGDIPARLKYTDLVVTGYQPHPRIIMKMIA